MEKRIELEKRGLAPDKIKELILDNCRSTSIQGLTDEFVNLESLSLINVGLTSLKGFPKLPKLKRLEMSDNRISNGLNALQTSPLLCSLNVSNNRIKDLEVLQPLSELKHLRVLDLFNNEVTTKENYREEVFKMLPNLSLLDGFDKDNKEVDDDEDEEDMNGNEDEEDEESDEEDDESDEEEDEEEDGVGLADVYKDNLEEESEGEEYEGEEEEEEESLDEDDDEAEEEAETTPRGKKRKLEDGGKEDGGSKKSNGPSD